MTNQLNSVKDYTGNDYPIKKYSRIISLVPSLTDLLFSFGLENSIVGVTKYCVLPPRAKDSPRIEVGGTKNPNIQNIISLHPDLVLVNQEENQLKHYQALIDAHIPVFVTFPKSVNDAVSLFYDLKILFSINLVPQLAELEKTLEMVQEKTKSIKRKKKVFCPIWKKPWMSFNKETFASSMIDICGGENIFNGCTERYPEISVKEILEKEPDIILLPDEPYKFQKDDKDELQDLFQNKNIKIELIHGTFHWYSFIMIRSLNELVNIIVND